MEKFTVKDLMVPLSGYATVSENANLCVAVKELKKAQKNFDQTRDRHRAILITDKNNRIVGKLSQLDVIRALEPKYLNIDNPQSLFRFGFSQDYLRLYSERSIIFGKIPLMTFVKKLANLVVKNFMYTPTKVNMLEEKFP